MAETVEVIGLPASVIEVVGPSGPPGPAGAPGPAGIGVGPKPAPNRWVPVWPVVQAANGQALAAGTIYASRTYLAGPVKAAAFDVSSPVAGGIGRLAVYDDGGYPFPGALLAQSADLACSTPGMKEAAFTISAPGYYWIAVQNTGPGSVNISASRTVNPFSPGMSVPNSTSFVQSSLTLTGQGATVPNPWPAGQGADAYPIPFLVQGA
jgi:hypothetical protein